MEQLMREMETSPSSRTDFENLVKQMSSATAPATTTTTAAAAASTSNQPSTSFSETISRTMERMQESEQQAESAQMDDMTENETDAFLAEMLKQLDTAGGGDGLGGEMGMAKLLEGMMEQLMSKEILYEPLKDLNDKVHPVSLSPLNRVPRWLRWESIPLLKCSIRRG
jgi:peroxin-19